MMKLPHAITVCCCLTLAAFAQNAALDGRGRVVHDDLLDKLAGSWKLTGTIAKQRAEHSVEAEWLLDHQFLRVHEKAMGAPSTASQPYEAMVFIGYDNASDRYVAHWLDIFGGRTSETLGYGTRKGDALEFVFEYPDGPFRTVFRWMPESRGWQWTMRQKDQAGQWTTFGEMTLAPATR